MQKKNVLILLSAVAILSAIVCIAIILPQFLPDDECSLTSPVVSEIDVITEMLYRTQPTQPTKSDNNTETEKDACPDTIPDFTETEGATENIAEATIVATVEAVSGTEHSLPNSEGEGEKETLATEPELEQNPIEAIYSMEMRMSVVAEMESRGSCGRLYIPSIGVDVALFETTMYDSKVSQPIVDAEDSAAYITDDVEAWGFPLIADHVHQGFAAIKGAVAGETIAYMHFGNRIESFICTKVFRGYNNGVLVDMDGNTLKSTNPGGLGMYTCNADGTITVVYWQPIGA